MRLVSANLMNYGSAPGEHGRDQQMAALLAELDADVLAVQEILASDPTEPDQPSKTELAWQRTRRLGEALGRRCALPDGTVACAIGGGIHHVALLWREGLTPVPDTLARFGRAGAGLWHSLVALVLDLGGVQLRVASVQLSPFSQHWGELDAAQILRALHRDTIVGVVGGDFNGVGASVVPTRDGGQSWYDPDPYTGVAWHPDHAYQLDEHGQLDRRVALRLERAGRMRDCAVLAGAPWTPTAGHHPDDRHPPRRIDRWYASHHLPAAAVRAVDVVAEDRVGHLTDHRPVLLDLDTTAL
ncbi:endonuclease/exonuclease/phosphatase family protein [Amycolatopsis arida]|uniref:endonuclease/exonuclease/phosphatase family protein n=1 Tax=Amycolatopsis arida TaxID=587909 RepID=UPI001067026C|nr:endonuclease/exonuclease/phosphatase family protein [Amycolatopsis arida]TDX84928.1 endonuclease/exonuclease/phosphatase family metal-dependent hydrolase [Amycolatopsis arida]